MQAKQLWQAVLSDLEGKISRTQFDNWLRPSIIVEFTDDHATIGAANTFSASTLQSRYAAQIEQVFSDIVGRPIHVTFTVLNAGDEPPARVPKTKDAVAPRSTRKPAQEPPPARTGAPQPNQQLELAPTPTHGLNPRYVYENYVVGSSNRFAHAASLSVAEHPGGRYNPFYIYGGVGLGKTHLLHAIGHRALEIVPTLTIVYVSSEKFTNDVINAIRQQRMEEFRARYRTIDILMIDDVQFIGGKDATQEEFFHTFNALYQSGKHVVISSDKPPKAIAGLEERLRSRFEGGLIVDVQLPDYEMRTAILRTKADELGVVLPDDVVEYVAQRDQSNIRALEGALNKILAHAEIGGRALSLNMAIEAMTEAGAARRREETTAETVLQAVADYFKVDLVAMRGRGRSKEIVLPRQIGMYLLREDMQVSLVEIGQLLGGRDHTTVMYGIEKIGRELQTDNALRGHVMRVREAVLSGSVRP